MKANLWSLVSGSSENGGPGLKFLVGFRLLSIYADRVSPNELRRIEPLMALSTP